ncbi:MAG: hypothetical protein CVU59_09215 [Deltaproteobacteria bacterium HGW-Deltaproteobacteria-17]|nr:MAG: hypothetical protein CVU59_09215 [Deltaproteobacteria bacterium HGW-Deltaproteobacteria-17]
MTLQRCMVTEPMSGWRVEKICSGLFPGRTRPQWQNLIDNGMVRVDGRRARRGDRPAAGSVLELLELPPEADVWTPAPTDPGMIRVILRTPRVLIVDKPPQLPTLPLTPEDAPTVAGALLAAVPGIVGAPPREAGIVNRLDNDTSGLILAGMDPVAQERLRQRFASHRIEKTYRALVQGCFPERPVWLSGRVFTQGTQRVRYEPGEGPDGQMAISLVTRLWEGGGLSLVEVVTRFGRRHQVRVQLAHAGHPILNDGLYAQASHFPFEGHFLWACRVAFADPETDLPQVVGSRFLPASWLGFAQAIGCGSHFEGVEAF